MTKFQIKNILFSFQSTETGAGGDHGGRVQNLVAVDHGPALARAPILLQVMVGKNAEG